MVLTKSEMEIMDVFWDSGKALSRADLLGCNEGKNWKDSSVHILLNGLLKKGAIAESGFVKRSKTYGRTFLPTVSREVYFANSVFSHRCKPEMLGLMTALLERPEATEDVMQALQAVLLSKQKA